MNHLQKLSQSALAPALILIVGALMAFIGKPEVSHLTVVYAAGNAILSNAWLIIAISLAYGLSKDNQGAAALAGAVGYFVVTNVATAVKEGVDAKIFAGLIMGVLAAVFYNRFYNIKLPEWLGFFGGKRFVPILTAFVAFVLGIAYGYLIPESVAVVAQYFTTL